MTAPLDYALGEIVDVTIRGVRVLATDCPEGTGYLNLAPVGDERWRIRMNPLTPGVTVTRVTSPETAGGAL